MKKISELLKEIKEKWTTPVKITYQVESIYGIFVSYLSDEKADFNNYPYDIPKELSEFWGLVSNAILFKDLKYGQWGLEILTPEEALQESHIQNQERPDNFINTDLVIGRFYGDSDILFVCCDKDSKDFGYIYVALPIDPRENWYLVALNFADFLELYLENRGSKFWEI